MQFANFLIEKDKNTTERDSEETADWHFLNTLYVWFPTGGHQRSRGGEGGRDLSHFFYTLALKIKQKNVLALSPFSR